LLINEVYERAWFAIREDPRVGRCDVPLIANLLPSRRTRDQRNAIQ